MALENFMNKISSPAMSAGVWGRLCCPENTSYHMCQWRIWKRVSLFAEYSDLDSAFVPLMHPTFSTLVLPILKLHKSAFELWRAIKFYFRFFCLNTFSIYVYVLHASCEYIKNTKDKLDSSECCILAILLNKILKENCCTNSKHSGPGKIT